MHLSLAGESRDGVRIDEAGAVEVGESSLPELGFESEDAMTAELSPARTTV